MKVDSQKIIADTLYVFSRSTAQKEKFSKIKEYVSTQDYLDMIKNISNEVKVDFNDLSKSMI